LIRIDLIVPCARHFPRSLKDFIVIAIDLAGKKGVFSASAFSIPPRLHRLDDAQSRKSVAPQRDGRDWVRRGAGNGCI
jgi:hypothetical protein